MSTITVAHGDPATADFMIIASTPGKSEAANGKVLVGGAGRIFWKAGAKPGLTRDRSYVTSVLHSRPTSKSGSPSSAQIRAEWQRLDNEMSTFLGEVLVLVGACALRRVTGRKNIMEWRGYCMRPSDMVPVEQTRQLMETYKTNRKCPVCADLMKQVAAKTKQGICAVAGGVCEGCGNTRFKHRAGDPKWVNQKFHGPAAIPPNVKWIVAVLEPTKVQAMRMVTLPMLQADIRRAARLGNGTCDPIVEPNPPYEWDPDAITGSRVTIDIETPYTSWAIDCVGLGFGDDPSLSWTSEWDKDTASRVRAIFTDPDIEKAFHNAAFDVPRLEQALGSKMEGRIFDTMWAAQFLRPDLPKGLVKVAPLYLDVAPWKHLAEERPAFYNQMDAYVQHLLAIEMEKRLKATRMMKPFHRFMDALPSLMGMHARGLRLDLDARDEWVAELEVEFIDVGSKWPWPEVNYNSYKQLQELFYGKLHLEVQYSKHGDTTTDAAALSALVRYCKETGQPEVVTDGIASLLKLREIGRNIAYYSAVEAGEDGCVHPEYLPTDKEKSLGGGSKTGRIQPRRPNIANQSARARYMYVPHDPTHRFLSVDWSQAEAWIEQSLSGDEALAMALRDDLHDTNMKAMGVDRELAKIFWYMTGRLGSARTLCMSLNKAGHQGITVKWCQERQDAIFQQYPDWAQWRTNTIKVCTERGYVEEPLGRRYYLFGRANGPTIVGYQPQAGVGSMLQEILPEVDEMVTDWGGGCIGLTLHDEIILEVPDQTHRSTRVYLQNIMEREWPEIAPGFKLKTDAEIGLPGESWGSMNARHK